MAKKILCVDDSATIRLLVKRALEPGGFEVIEAANGSEALDVVDDTFAMCIVDVNMPVLDGFGFVEAAKKKPELSALPMVFLTTESSAAVKERGKQLGVNGWIVKPFKPADLTGVVNSLTN